MGIDAKDLIIQIIRPALCNAHIWSKAAEQLLAGTCAQESQMGTYFKQQLGPALGIFQMEPATHDDIWNNFLKYNPDLVKLVLKSCGISDLAPDQIPSSDLLVYNLRYSVCMARLKYMRAKDPLPAYNDILAQAEYWKKIYNTVSGKGDTAAYANNYNRFLRNYYGSL